MFEIEMISRDKTQYGSVRNNDEKEKNWISGMKVVLSVIEVEYGTVHNVKRNG